MLIFQIIYSWNLTYLKVFNLKAVITAAGIGTRMLPITKEIPKEMFPIIVYVNGHWTLRPTLQVIFETLFAIGVREFCFIVNRFKRVIENYFSPDEEFINLLKRKGKIVEAEDLRKFYEKIKTSTIVYINQYEQLGFGHAVLLAKSFVGSEPFIVHAGDDYIISPDNDHLKRLIRVFNEFKANATVLIERISDPRKYGVVNGQFITDDIIEVNTIIEKPKEPPTNLAVVAVYIFNDKIFKALREVGFDESGEIPLSAAIDYLAKMEGGVYGVLLKEGEKRVDVGSPEAYIQGLNLAYGEVIG